MQHRYTVSRIAATKLSYYICVFFSCFLDFIPIDIYDGPILVEHQNISLSVGSIYCFDLFDVMFVIWFYDFGFYFSATSASDPFDVYLNVASAWDWNPHEMWQLLWHLASQREKLLSPKVYLSARNAVWKISIWLFCSNSMSSAVLTCFLFMESKQLIIQWQRVWTTIEPMNVFISIKNRNVRVFDPISVKRYMIVYTNACRNIKKSKNSFSVTVASTELYKIW